MERTARIKLASAAWKATAQSLYHVRLLEYSVVKDSVEVTAESW
jgi:hypothetical protein